MNKNKQLFLNMTASLATFFVGLGINFFLTPFIVTNVSSEAYGFVSLANNLVEYATVLTIALNSMAGRFITIKIHQNDIEGSNRYFNSVLIANVIFSVIIMIPAVFLVLFADSALNISTVLVLDVKILFAFVFMNFILSVISSTFNVATFATNKLYLSSKKTFEAQIIRVILIIALFSFLTPKVYYIGIASVIVTVFCFIYNIYYTKILIPQIKINKIFFDFKAVKEVVSSGIWSSISKTGSLLLNGLDLLIANLFISPVEMGVLAIAKTFPTMITRLSMTMRGVFAPQLTIEYAKDKKENLKREIKKGMKLTTIFLTIPLTILIVYGEAFYSLWVPGQDAVRLQILSILTCFGLIFTSGTQILFNVFTVVNKLKVNSLMVVLSGAVSAIIVLIVLKTTSLGIYAVAAVSSCIMLLKSILFTLPYAAKCLNYKATEFFPEVLKSAICVIIMTVIGFAINKFVIIDSWLLLALCAIVMTLIGFSINAMIILNADERRYLVEMTKKIYKKFQ